MIIIKEIKQFLKIIEKDHISEYTAQCAYYIILSFIPFLITMITLLQYTVVDKEILYYVISEILPQNLDILVIDIVEEVYSKSIETFSISLIVTLWSAGKGFYALCKGLRSAYNVNNKKTYIYFRLRGMVFTIIFIAIISIVFLLIVFGNIINNIFEEKFPQMSKIFTIIIKFRFVGTIIILFFIFLIIYKFVPNHHVKFKKQIPGAIVASVGWIVISYVFSIYLDLFKGFSVMYGSLTTIVLTMMWLYACIYMILIGAEINKYFLK